METQGTAEQDGSVGARLRALGLALPAVPAAVAAYVPAAASGASVWTSGQLPFQDGRLLTTGRVGDKVTIEEAYEAARLSALNALAAAAQAAGGVDRIAGVLKVVGFVQSGPDFHDQPKVVNGASELYEALFGNEGRHARSAVGVSSLPLDAPVEIEVIFRLHEAR